MAGHYTGPEDATAIDCNVFEHPLSCCNASILLLMAAQMEVSSDSLHSFFRNAAWGI